MVGINDHRMIRINNKGKEREVLVNDVQSNLRPREIIPLVLPTSARSNGHWISIAEAVSNNLKRSNENLPYYMLPVLGVLPSVHHVYAEWYYGLDKNPPIELMLKTFGSRWRDDNRARLARRNFLIEEIKMRESDGFTTAEVLVLLDMLKGKDRLNRLVDVKLLNRPR
ncbi:3895_t:CDS:1 [Acaulospora colombiana]|uniref:3895_t:CDS:1 n=1 Tax=Acaulospora colombiana TaxID=27376 RepID=A0ACA9JYU8_9GLOM|nr:3895_t:CDS:1 [Acaulospora colombiana]